MEALVGEDPLGGGEEVLAGALAPALEAIAGGDGGG
jgi:hypothetical protein